MQIRPTALISGLKGKLGGTVFQMNASRIYARTNASSNKPNSQHWQTQKMVMAFVSSSWRTLVPAKRLAWNSVKGSWPSYDKYGNPRTPSGYEVFCKVNMTSLANGGRLIKDAFSPSPLEVNFFEYVPLVTSSAFNLFFRDAGSGLQFYQIYVAPPTSIGAEPSKPAFCSMGIFPNNLLNTYSIFAEVVKRYGPIVINSRYQVAVKVLSDNKGFNGNIITSSQISS